jgi:hypothetical protein
MAETSWRNWKVKNGVYATDNSGAVTHWLLVANTHQGAEWQVLGMYCTEDDVYCFNYNSGDPWDKWARFLQDEVVRLAEDKGLMPEDTGLLICRQEGFYGSQIEGSEV